MTELGQVGTAALAKIDEAELAAVKRLCRRIKSNAHLKVIVRNAEPEMREAVYTQLVQYITKFKPVPFDSKWASDA